jgi:hypothetical protein
MVGEDQVGLRRNPWHVARRAGLAGDVHPVTLSGMAFPAGGVIGRKLGFERGMRRVTRQTRHTSARGLEAVAGRQHYRLMARVPRVLKICRIPLYAWHAVALTAEIVELSRVELSGISGTYLCGIYYVIRGGSMTRLAPNSQFVGCDYLVRRDLQRAARVTTEAAKYSGLRVKDSVLYSAGVPMSRSKSNAIELAVPGFVLFDIDLRIQPTYKCDGLYTRAERPESWLGRFRRR